MLSLPANLVFFSLRSRNAGVEELADALDSKASGLLHKSLITKHRRKVVATLLPCFRAFASILAFLGFWQTSHGCATNRIQHRRMLAIEMRVSYAPLGARLRSPTVKIITASISFRMRWHSVG